MLDKENTGELHQVNGRDYRIALTDFEEQVIVGIPYWLKGKNIIVNTLDSQRLLAKRYLSDPRVIVEGYFEGSVKSPDFREKPLSDETKTDLEELLKNLFEFPEVIFR